MGIGVSVFLIAAGAVLTFALEKSVEGIDLDTVGIIMMVVGALGLLLTMTMFSSWNDRRGGVVRGGVVRDDVVIEERRTL